MTRRWLRVAAPVVLLSASAIVGGAAPVASAPTQQQSCGQPYLPVFGSTRPSGYDPSTSITQVYPERPTEAPDLDGAESLDYRELLGQGGNDTDGDGQADDVGSEPLGNLTITRSDGIINIGDADHSLGLASSDAGLDLDDDGRDELYFLSRDAGGDAYYLLPGGTAPGNYRPEEVAIRLPGPVFAPVGDQVPGPGEDLLVATSGASGTIVSGTDLLAPGPGGQVEAFVARSESFTDFPSGVLALDDGPPTLAFTRSADGDQTLVTLWNQGVTTEYQTAGEVHLSPPPVVTASRSGNGNRYLVAANQDRGGSLVYYWDIDDPCSQGGNAPPTAPSAPPARPVDGGASYTG